MLTHSLSSRLSLYPHCQFPERVPRAPACLRPQSFSILSHLGCSEVRAQPCAGLGGVDGGSERPGRCVVGGGASPGRAECLCDEVRRAGSPVSGGPSRKGSEPRKGSRRGMSWEQTALPTGSEPRGSSRIPLFTSSSPQTSPPSASRRQEVRVRGVREDLHSPRPPDQAQEDPLR